jgi:HPt (histidine-containing phosphotransfer) domain-containing protein
LTTSILRHVRISALLGATPTASLSEPPAPETVPWPVIAGIDLTDARVRLCDDFGLFVSNLRRLLDEFADVSVPSASEEFDVLTLHAARMHKLSGAAGMLGANAIQQLAVDARMACVAGEGKMAERLVEALGVELRRLGESAAPVLEEARARADQAVKTAARSEAPLRPEHLADLILSLRQQSLSARYRFDAISGELRSMLGDGTFEIVRHQVENLRFMEAAKVIEESRSPGRAGLHG